MEPVVATAQGKVQGKESDGVFVFRGVPFAAPPVGPLRLLPPRPAQRWEDVRDATRFGPVCPQNPSPMEQMFGAREPFPQDEDCLTLNVWTPEPGGAGRPVMVWIHGGAYTQGSGRTPWYDGTSFARDGVVLVTINYRLGPLGFLHTEEDFGDAFAGSANAGILDQVAALEWVRENIAAFGGDPGNVTIFGESAGGMSVGTLLGCAAAAGLFHKAIPQSGAAHNAHPASVASRITARFLDEAGVRPGDADALRDLPVERLLAATDALGTDLQADPTGLFGEDFTGAALPFQPVIDGAALDRVPIEAVRDGSARGVRVLVGTTAEEWRLFAAMMPEGGVRTRAHRPLRNLCERAGRSADELVAAYEWEGRSEIDVRSALETDRVFRIPAVRLAEAQCANATPAYMYLFAWRTPVWGGRLGACHALEIPFVFDSLDAPGADIFCGKEAPRELAGDVHGAWVRFATDGDPGWGPYDVERRPTMVLDVPFRMSDDPGGAERTLWDGIL